MVIDDGLATELEKRGCDISGDLWSALALLDFPDTIEAVHLDYLSAGGRLRHQRKLSGFF